MAQHFTNERIDSIYNSLSNEQKMEYKNKQEKLSKSSIIIGIIFIPIVIAVLILSLVLAIPEKMYALLVFALIMVAIIGVIIWRMILLGLRGLKATDETKTKMYIERLERQKENQKRDLARGNILYKLPIENIKNVTILDAYTEMSDKLHAVLNYQEIIQTRIYKFKVDYNDGTSQIVTAIENSKEYNMLIPLVNKNSVSQPIIPDKSNIEKIREYKCDFLMLNLSIIQKNIIYL